MTARSMLGDAEEKGEAKGLEKGKAIGLEEGRAERECLEAELKERERKESEMASRIAELEKMIAGKK